jgi:hypothetical protein
VIIAYGASTLAEWAAGVTFDDAWLGLWTCIFSAVVVARLCTGRSKE